MNSVKTVATVALFLGVVYGVYQVINNQGAYVEDDSPIVDASGKQLVSGIGVEIDPESMSDEELEAVLFGDGSEFEEPDDSAGGGFDMNFDDLSDDNNMNFDTGEEASADASVDYDSFSFNSDQSAADSQSASDSSGSFDAKQTIDEAARAIGLPAPNKTVEQAKLAVEDAKQSLKNAAADGGQMIANSFAPQSAQNNPAAQTGQDKINQFAQAATSGRDALADARNATGQAIDNAKEKPAETALNAAAGALNSMFNRQSKPTAPAGESELNSSFASGEAAPANTAAQGSTAAQANTKDLTAALERARIMIEQNKFRDALTMLTSYYGDAKLTADQNRQLLEWLDPLAGKVIYSSEHLVAQAHVVRPGDTLEKIAAAYNISPQLVYNINRASISNPNLLTPGAPLKVVQGPFNARLNLETSELTLFLGDMYAGRFVVSMGRDAPTTSGRFTLAQKSDQGHDYQDPSGKTIPSTDPTNPYGRFWLGLDNGVVIHSTSQTGDLEDSRGCISLSPIDAEDVYGILTAGSQVLIR